MKEDQNISLAERALQMYDEQQDLEFLRFLVSQRRQDQQLEPVLRDEWERGICLLQDNSVVQLNDPRRQGETSFRWHNGIIESRPARMGPGSLPTYPGAVRPLLEWPSSETLRQTILQRLEQDAREEIIPDADWNPGNEPILKEYDALKAAPGLNDAVLEFMRERYNMPESLLNMLDEEAQECARMIVGELPEETLTALQQAIEARVREETGEETGEE